MQHSSGPDYVANLREAIGSLQTGAAQLVAGERGMYRPGSQAAIEHASYSKPSAVFNASSFSVQLIESGAEHLSVLAKILVEPIEGIAAWTCVRSMLESCALAAWLLDPAIDAHTRVRRVFTLRYEGMDQELRFGGAANRPANEIARQEAQIDAVEMDAASLGFAALRNRKGKRIGIGETMPTATEIIKLTLDEETMYRLLSAVAHGHSWAIRQLCYAASATDDKLIGGTTQVKVFKKAIGAEKIAVLSQCAVRTFIRPLWNQCRYNGWNSLLFEELFENVADRVSVPANRRFWRDYSVPAVPQQAAS